MIMMGSWMKINSDETEKHENWSDRGDETGYNHNGEFEWERIGENKIRIKEKGVPKVWRKLGINYKRKMGEPNWQSLNLNQKKFGQCLRYQFVLMFRLMPKPMKPIFLQ